MESRVMRTGEAATFIGVSKWKLRQLVKSGKIGFVSDGDRTSALRFLKEDLDAYLQAYRVPPKTS